MSDSQTIGFGEALRAAREAAQMDLRELSDATKIQTRYIEALESEQFDRVPGAIIGRGFLRVLAKELNADSDALMELYKAARGEEEACSIRPPQETEWRVGPPRKPWPDTRALALGAILLLAALVLVWVWSPWADSQDSKDKAVSTDVVHQLEIRAVARTWVRVEGVGLDGDQVALAPAETVTFEAPAPLTLELPDVDGVRLSWDGVALKSPETAGETTTVVLPRDLGKLKP